MQAEMLNHLRDAARDGMQGGMPIHMTHSLGRRDYFSPSACLPVSQSLQTNGILEDVLFLDSLFFTQLKEEQDECLQKPTYAAP